MRCRLGNTAVKCGILVFPISRENADTTQFYFTAEAPRTYFLSSNLLRLTVPRRVPMAISP